MQFTKEQFALINVALQTNEKKELRTFPLAEQKDAMTIYDKLIVHVDEGKMFTDGEEEFTTTEKALILKLLDREWDVQILKTVFSIKELLA